VTAHIYDPAVLPQKEISQ